MEAIIFVLFILFAAVMVPFGLAQQKKTNEAWSRASRNLGMSFAAGSLFRGRRLQGRVHGFFVKIDSYRRSRGSGSNSSSQTYTRFVVRFPHGLGLGLRLTTEGFFSGVTKFFGAQDVQIGDASFDSEVLVKARNAARVRKFLTPARRMRIRRFLNNRRGATIDDSALKWTRTGLVRSSHELESIVRSMVRLAWQLTQDSEDDLDFEVALKARDEGRPGDALERLKSRRARRERRARTSSPRRMPEVPRPAEAAPSPAVEEPALLSDASSAEPALSGPEDSVELVALPPELEAGDVDEKVFEGELLHLAGRKEEAKAVFEAALEASPEDEEIRAWVEESSREPSVPATPAPAAESVSVSSESSEPNVVVADTRGETGRGGAESAPAVDIALDVDAVCRELFDPSRTSLHASRIFESRYEGRGVTWTGKLKSVESFPFDFVFGSDPAGKAVVEVFEAGESVYGGTQVFAVVKVSQEAVAELSGLVDGEVELEGTLLKVDGFMRNIYVTDGQLRSA